MHIGVHKSTRADVGAKLWQAIRGKQLGLAPPLLDGVARLVGISVQGAGAVSRGAGGSLRPLLAQIERRDRDLGRQLRRASSSVALNLAEGMYSQGQLRTARYHTALGSMRESTSCLEVARAFGYVHSLDDAVFAQINRITGTLVRLVEGHR